MGSAAGRATSLPAATLRARTNDFWLVEDTGRRRLASSLGLISHRMSYDGIGFDAGQIELVSTHPEYRKRRLIRTQREVVHAANLRDGAAHLRSSCDAGADYWR